MINSVSDRIRSLIKSQDQATPQSQLYRSRDNSVDSVRSGSGVNSKSNNHIPPKSPHKARSQLHKSEVSQENSQPVPKEDYSELIEKIKTKVMELVYPLLMELTKKVENVAQAASAGTFKKEMEANWRRIQSDFQTHLDKVRVKLENIQKKDSKDKQIYEIQNQLARLDSQYSILSTKIEKINLTHILHEQLSINPTPPQKYPKNTSESTLNHNNRDKQFINTQQNKCKCQKLVEEILKSQNHLMMELKYVKHFQNYNQSVNTAGNISKNYSSRGR